MSFYFVLAVADYKTNYLFKLPFWGTLDTNNNADKNRLYIAITITYLCVVKVRASIPRLHKYKVILWCDKAH